jgi:hypothetical protein
VSDPIERFGLSLKSRDVFLLPAWVSAHDVPLSSNLDGLGSERDFAFGLGHSPNVRLIFEDCHRSERLHFGRVRAIRAARPDAWAVGLAPASSTHRAEPRQLSHLPIKCATRSGRKPKQCVNGNAMERHPTERGWAAKLRRPLVLKDGTTVATLADARSFILRQPNHIQEHRAWQRAAELMIKPPSMAATSKRRPLGLNSRCSLSARLTTITKRDLASVARMSEAISGLRAVMGAWPLPESSDLSLRTWRAEPESVPDGPCESTTLSSAERPLLEIWVRAGRACDRNQHARRFAPARRHSGCKSSWQGTYCNGRP